MTVCTAQSSATGSVGLPFDGDPRSSYLIVEDGRPRNLRVEYDVERAAWDVEQSGHPDAAAIAGIYRSGRAPA